MRLIKNVFYTKFSLYVAILGNWCVLPLYDMNNNYYYINWLANYPKEFWFLLWPIFKIQNSKTITSDISVWTQSVDHWLRSRLQKNNLISKSSVWFQIPGVVMLRSPTCPKFKKFVRKKNCVRPLHYSDDVFNKILYTYQVTQIHLRRSLWCAHKQFYDRVAKMALPTTRAFSIIFCVISVIQSAPSIVELFVCTRQNEITKESDEGTLLTSPLSAWPGWYIRSWYLRLFF